jgi:hypothetical protein
VRIEVPVSDLDSGEYMSTQITITNLTRRQQQAYRRVWKQLVAQTARLRDGRMVSNQFQYDTIRWMLDEIADQLGIPA